MSNQKKLDLWATQLLDTGKRNALINFTDKKASTAEIVYPDCESLFKQCSMGTSFEVFNPGVFDQDTVTETLETESADNKKEAFKNRYASNIKNKRTILAYAQSGKPIDTVRKIAKKENDIQEETGVNVAYLSFGFVKWSENEGSNAFWKAPLLLVHVNVISGSRLDPVKIEICDDDVLINPTFNYLLQADYGIALPPFEDEYSLSDYYQEVSGIINKLGWSIVDECKLGLFSFQKINMYSDLEQNGELILGNNNVQALLGEPVQSDMGFGDGEIDEHVVTNPLIELHTVVDADSSQITAIEMAKSGKSFVLQGPPGTGKSQTITNIIAECLHDGKKVLFVSEKQAALNVVFDKLKKVGLNDFCLELHSHKANKKAVIEELNRTLNAPKTGVYSQALEDVKKKAEAQRSLDAYAFELHKKREPIQKSFYELLDSYSSERYYPELQIIIPDIQEKGADYYDSALAFLDQYVDYIPSIGRNYKTNSWYGFNYPHISFDERNQFEAEINRLHRSYANLKETTSTVGQKYRLLSSTFNDAINTKEFLSFLAETDVITPALLSQSGFDSSQTSLIKMKELSESILPVRDEILKSFRKEFIENVNGNNLYETLTGQYAGLINRTFNSDYKQLINGIRNYEKNANNLSYSQAVSLAKNLMQLQDCQSSFNEIEKTINGCVGPCYSGVETDWDHVFSELQRLDVFVSRATKDFGSIAEMTPNRFINNQSLFQSFSNQLADSIAEATNATENLTKYFDSSTLDLNDSPLSEAIHKVSGWANNTATLPNWTAFLLLLENLNKLELMPYIDAVIEQQIAPEDITGAFQRAFHKRWIEYLLSSVEELKSFSRVKHDKTVLEFCKKDIAQYDISKSQIISELSQQRPKMELNYGGGAVSTLLREGKKKRKQKPIRVLFSEIGDLVQTLKPCFLMSPLSVSTFLEPGKISFDTVIFDEASQIFPQDAIGAIYRGKQLIVVGDSRQMPPSNFFTATTEIDTDDEELADITDFESILDICSTAFPTERLAWHYRSHYEPLIAFSNAHFYNNSLMTFPSSTPDHKGIGVDYHHVDGIFDRKSKTNRAEADYIVDLIYENIEEYPNRSLGVVAFSQAQQDLIDNLLSKRREQSPEFEDFFSSSKPEPFFIKNLESVQGDERDTIIFSVAYAKDNQGRFILNFGPLNRDGGERRLNVAVTRAKDNVQLVASIYYTDIDLNRAQSEGARLLRAYLDYAQNGPIALDRTISVSGKDHFDSYFEQEVCDFLRDNGYTVDTQVGCSGYRIDLGLRTPNSSEYVLAIECDGATYHSSKNARDRDRLRQSVLEKMGWQFYRIWSTDWYRNNAVEKERLLQAVELAKTKKRVVKAKKVKPKKTPEEKNNSNRYSAVIESAPLKFPKYNQVDAIGLVHEYPGEFQAAIYEILKTEAPLAEDYLLRRIVTIFGRDKLSGSVRDQFNRLMRGCENYGITRKNGFLYLQGKTKYHLRVPGTKRDIKYICPEELASGMYILIRENVSFPRDDLYKSLTNLLGFTRTGAKIVEQYDQALSILLNNNLVTEENGILKTTSNSLSQTIIPNDSIAPETPKETAPSEKKKAKVRKIQM